MTSPCFLFIFRMTRALLGVFCLLPNTCRHRDWVECLALAMVVVVRKSMTTTRVNQLGHLSALLDKPHGPQAAAGPGREEEEKRRRGGACSCYPHGRMCSVMFNGGSIVFIPRNEMNCRSWRDEAFDIQPRSFTIFFINK